MSNPLMISGLVGFKTAAVFYLDLNGIRGRKVSTSNHKLEDAGTYLT